MMILKSLALICLLFAVTGGALGPRFGECQSIQPTSPDSQNRGLTKLEIRQEPKIQWKYSAGDDEDMLGLVATENVVAANFRNRVCGLDINKGTEIWSLDIERVRDVAWSGAESNLILISHTAGITAVRPADGQTIWEADIDRGCSAAVCYDGIVFAPGYAGAAYAISASDGTKIWEHDFLDDAPADPPGFDGNDARLDGDAARPGGIATDGDLVCFGVFDQCRLIAVDCKSGDRRWDHQTRGWTYMRPSISDKHVFFGSQDGNFYCVNRGDGTLEWKHQTGGRVAAPGASDGEQVVFSSCDSHVYCFAAEMGYEIWKTKADISEAWNYAPFYAQSLISPTMVYAPSMEGQLYGLDRETGIVIWKIRPVDGGEIIGQPQVSGDRLVVATRTGLNEAAGASAVVALGK